MFNVGLLLIQTLILPRSFPRPEKHIICQYTEKSSIYMVVRSEKGSRRGTCLGCISMGLRLNLDLPTSCNCLWVAVWGQSRPWKCIITTSYQTHCYRKKIIELQISALLGLGMWDQTGATKAIGRGCYISRDAMHRQTSVFPLFQWLESWRLALSTDCIMCGCVWGLGQHSLCQTLWNFSDSKWINCWNWISKRVETQHTGVNQLSQFHTACWPNSS